MENEGRVEKKKLAHIPEMQRATGLGRELIFQKRVKKGHENLNGRYRLQN